MKALLITWMILGGAIASGCSSILQSPSSLSPSPTLLTDHITDVKVTRVVSGHTIEVQPIQDNRAPLNQTIRLFGIQAPSDQQTPWGPDAKAYLEELLLGQTVQLSVEPEQSNSVSSLESASVDAYGRQWAYVWLAGQLVNQQLLADGLVMVEERSPHLSYNDHFSHAQHRARILGLGIWDPKEPLRQTPEDFRQSQE